MEKSHINLVILSPLAEVNKLELPGVSTATSINELKEKISDLAVSHPAPAQQRLIYRGHALIRGEATLKDIFSQEIIDSSESLSLHLVLPPVTAAQPPATSASSATPGQSRHARTPQHVHGSADIAGHAPGAQQGTTTMNTVHGLGNQDSIPPPSLHFQAQAGHGQGVMHGHGHGHGTLPLGQFPPQLQQAFAQFHAVNQQLAAQIAAIGNSPVLQGMPTNQPQAQQFQQPAIPQPSFQHLVAQQQQARANAGHHGLSGTPQQNVQGNTFNPSNTGAPTLSDNGQNPAVASPPNLANTNTIVRENHGPHGERWQMVIQSGPMNRNPSRSSQSTSPAPPSSPFAGGNSPMQASPASRATQLPRNPNTNAAAGRTPAPLQAGNGQPPTANVALMHLQSNLSTIEAAMAGGNPLPESVFDQAREMLRGTLGLSQEQESWLRTRLNNLCSRASQLRENLHQHLIRAAQERVASQRATQGADSSAVYVVSSPSGPHALLVSPSGLYTTPWQFSTLGTINPHSSTSHSPDVVTQAHPTGHANTEQQAQADSTPAAQVQQEAPQLIDAAQAAQGQQQQQQQQQVNQAGDMIRNLLPLGGHLWLLLRLFGFVYFFTAGAGWRRTILLGLIASLVFIAQTGIFRPVIQGLWDPVRRHAEGLVPLAGNEHPRIGAVGAGENANAAGTQPANREPTPQEAAERILQERERRNVNIVRQTFRRAERAVALFVASLVPGVGERHIAAREAAEAARQAEAREREESARREEEVTRQQQEGGYDSGNAGADENASGAGEGADTTTRRARHEVAQLPLVEV